MRSRDGRAFRIDSPAAGGAIVAGAFLVTRIAAALSGVRFDASPLDTFYQFLAPGWLRAHFVESIAHLHMQPPLLNIVTGAALAVGDASDLAWLWRAMGLAAALALHDLLRRLGVPAALAVSLSVIHVASPAALLYENLLFYTLPVAAMLSVGAWAMHRYLHEARAGWGLLAFTMLAAVCLTRSIFHLAWLIAVVGLVTALGPRDRKRTMLVAALPTLAVVAWSVRTAILFGTFGASTWLGMSVAKITTMQGPLPERTEMIRAGTLSPFAAVPPFRDLRAYRAFVEEPPPSGIACLDEASKPNGRKNLNHRAYVDVSRAYARDAVTVLRERPDWYGRGVKTALTNGFHPTSGGEFVQENRERVPWLTTPYAGFHVAGNLPAMLLFAGITIGGVLAAARGLRRSPRDPDTLLLAILTGTIVWTFLVGNLLDVGENYRFRFLTFPAQFAVAGVLLAAGLGRRRAST